MKYSVALFLLCCVQLSLAKDCSFDADDADSPYFATQLTQCKTGQEQQKPASPTAKPMLAATQLYGDGSINPISGISERPVAAAGSLKHHSNQLFEAREAYSLRPNAKFEDSVTFAIHKLHVQMAHYCGQGAAIEQQWTASNPAVTGDFYLYYRFRCAP